MYISWLKTLGGHVHRLAEDTRGTCTYVGWLKTLEGHVHRLVEDTRGTCT